MRRQPKPDVTHTRSPASDARAVSLKLRLVVLLFLLPLLVVAGWLLTRANEALTQSRQTHAQAVAADTIDSLDRLLDERRKDVVTMAGLPAVRTLDHAQLPSILDSLVTGSSPYYKLGLVADWQGRVIAVNRVDGASQPIPSAQLIGQSVAGEPWFVETVQATHPVRFEDFHVDPLLQAMSSDGQAVLSLSVPVVNDERAVVGVLSVRLASDPLREILMSRLQGNSSTGPAALALLNQQSQSFLATPGLSQSGIALLATAGSRGFLDSVGLNWRAQVYGLPNQVLLPSPQRILLGVALGLLLAGAGIAWATDRHVLEPMRKLTRQRGGQPGPHDVARKQEAKATVTSTDGGASRDLESAVQSRTQELNKVREELQKEIAERVRLEEALRQAQSQSEQRISKRPLSLARTSEALQAEIAESK